MSERHRLAKRFRYRRRKQAERVLAIMQRGGPRTKFIENGVEIYNRVVDRLNRRRSSREHCRFDLIESEWFCDKCGRHVYLFASPMEWERYRQRGNRYWKVTGYGPATGECECPGFIADTEDGTRRYVA